MPPKFKRRIFTYLLWLGFTFLNAVLRNWAGVATMLCFFMIDLAARSNGRFDLWHDMVELTREKLAKIQSLMDQESKPIGIIDAYNEHLKELVSLPTDDREFWVALWHYFVPPKKQPEAPPEKPTEEAPKDPSHES